MKKNVSKILNQKENIKEQNKQTNKEKTYMREILDLKENIKKQKNRYKENLKTKNENR